MGAESPKHIPQGDKKFSKTEKLLVGAYVADILAVVGTTGITIGATDGSLAKIGIGAVAIAAEVGFGYFGAKKVSAYIDRSTRRKRESSLPLDKKDIR